MAPATQDEIAKRVRKDLDATAFAPAALTPLAGGTANFIEAYLATRPDFKLTWTRCRIEEEYLKALSSKLPFTGEASSNGLKFIVRTPKLYHFDEQGTTQTLEYLPNSKDLKTYALKTFSAGTPDMERPKCLQLGNALGAWLRKLHTWSATQSELRRTEMFREVKDMATRELGDESRQQVIHGDLWTGDVLLPDAPIRSGEHVTAFFANWEMSQVGVPELDVGQMVAELYELKLGYGPASEDSAFRTAIQGWGTPEQVAMVAQTGKKIIFHAWRRNRAWLKAGDLACLFSQG
ncbi:kinase-like domain-containing protein [Xylariaceae sp. FL0804]|nr:kinase-like domain-containing protein [Xylariaceae sp. FL0804]